MVGPYRSDADGLAGALKKFKIKKISCVNVEIYHTGMDMCSCFRIIGLAYVVYVRANRGWRLWSSMRIVYRFGIEKVVSYDFIILIDCDRMYHL